MLRTIFRNDVTHCLDSLYSSVYTKAKKEVSCVMDILKVFASSERSTEVLWAYLKKLFRKRQAYTGHILVQ